MTKNCSELDYRKLDYYSRPFIMVARELNRMSSTKVHLKDDHCANEVMLNFSPYVYINVCTGMYS